MFNKILRKISRMLMPFLTRFRIDHIKGVKKIGKGYGEWYIKNGILNENSICYCAGAGTNIDFDLSLAKDFGAKVFIFDPTPKSILFLKKVEKENNKLKWFENIKFLPIGLWGEDTFQNFFLPINENNVSSSILNLTHSKKSFTAECKKISTLMKQFNHSKIDLLKLDIEGAEYSVINSILKEKIFPKILCVEFDEIHSPRGLGSFLKIRKSVRDILKQNYKLIHKDGSNFTFLRD